MKLSSSKISNCFNFKSRSHGIDGEIFDRESHGSWSVLRFESYRCNILIQGCTQAENSFVYAPAVVQYIYVEPRSCVFICMSNKFNTSVEFLQCSSQEKSRISPYLGFECFG